MLIGIRHPNGVVEGAEYAKQVAEHLDGKTQIINPRSWDDYREALVAYKPNLKNHLILLSTHHELFESTDTPEPKWRTSEIYFDQKGGAIFGVEPEIHKSLWVSELTNDPSRIAKHATINAYRAIEIKKIAGANYYGRTSSDPHTLLVGFTPRFNSTSGIATQVVGSLPDEWGQFGDWSGVGYLNIVRDDAKFTKITDWFKDWTNIVALGPGAHEALTRIGVEHGVAPIPTGNGRFKNQLVYPKYGLLLREVARYGEDRLNWTP